MKPAKTESYSDGSRYEIAPDGSWDLTLPDGKHLRMKSKDVAEAERAIMAARNFWILNCWNKGELTSIPGKRQHFLCPLSSN